MGSVTEARVIISLPFCRPQTVSEGSLKFDTSFCVSNTGFEGETMALSPLLLVRF